ncbi:MarR family winged helix-turn-helix transcriptional regulator [Pseudoprimorskyibacter insulae]|uniref:Transcriptional regulator SlyA n=1 Tax=Pseudoprimorskyibacter insulae TaxID=1695997 RepID=A0A2R8AN29_9RHOB|nr:MarR family winged helix-turn-helix transcriptional regulator [Pseudoprimorskyibacter insulae]SPF77452.1 Transcriptional regulator SlyA [Pseudoprimorskyibacter insulae]
MTEKNDFALQQFLPYMLNQAAEASSLGFQQAYKERYGMLRTEWRVLFHLGLYGRMRAQDIVARASIHKTKVSRAVQRLEDRRFLKRERDEEDRRREHLELTAAGLKAYKDLYAIASKYEAQLTEGLTAQELSELRRLLAVLEQNGRKRLKT